MNQIDKFSVDFEIWWNSNVLRKNQDRILEILLKIFAKEKQGQDKWRTLIENASL